MSNLRTLEINICEFKTEAIAHICNCVTTTAKGVAQSINKTYPYADIYSGRTKPDTTGTLILKKGEKDQPVVANLLAQYYPGKPKGADSYENRKAWFFVTLDLLGTQLKELKIKHIAFPYGTGCGLAGGKWEDYYKMLQIFAEKNPDLQITLCKI